jgi:tRNA (cytidine56-2'-O)-methyltransferase
LLAVLRLGHRPLRDKRITTHVCLVARAFGAARVLLTERDDALVRNVRGVGQRFGGGFEVEVDARSHRAIIADWKRRGALVVHLTMYGQPHGEAIPAIRAAAAEGDVLVVVGAEKVPGDLYELADLNVAVGNEPHSEVAALAVLLHDLDPASLGRDRPGGALRIRPRARGKEVAEAPGGERPAGPAAGRRPPPGEPVG